MFKFNINLREMYNVLARMVGLPQASNQICAEELSKLGQALVDVERGVLEERKYRGDLAGSIGYKVAGNELIVGPNVNGDTEEWGKVWAVWKGGIGGWVPTAKLSHLEGWMDSRGIPREALFAMRQSIYQKGTSQWRAKEKGSLAWDFPEQTMASADGQKAINDASEKGLIKIKDWIEGTPLAKGDR